MPEESKKKTHKSLSLTLAVHQRVMARAEATGLTPETVLVTLMDVVDEPAFRRAWRRGWSPDWTGQRPRRPRSRGRAK